MDKFWNIALSVVIIILVALLWQGTPTITENIEESSNIEVSMASAASLIPSEIVHEADRAESTRQLASRKADAHNSNYEHPIRYNGYADVPGYRWQPNVGTNGQPTWSKQQEIDHYYLSRLLACEASTDWKDQIYAGSVIMNRVKHPSYNYVNSVYEVIFDTRFGQQYSCWTERGKLPKEPSEKNKAAAYELVMYGSQIPHNVVFQAQFPQGDGIYEVVGNHYYCYINN